MKNQLEVTSRSTASASTRSETVCSKALAVSISQMTIGTAPSLAASAAPQPTAVPTLPAVAPPLRTTAMPAEVADTAPTVAHTSAQLATGHPYAVHPPPPGFSYLPAGYSPYFGMYPYPYPQYVPPLPPVHSGSFHFRFLPRSLTLLRWPWTRNISDHGSASRFVDACDGPNLAGLIGGDAYATPGCIGRRDRDFGIGSRRPGSHLHRYSHAENIWKALHGLC